MYEKVKQLFNKAVTTGMHRLIYLGLGLCYLANCFEIDKVLVSLSVATLYMCLAAHD